MKALILVGGYGTRLRPLTFSCPKSVIPFANTPMVQLQIEALAKVGCTEVILAINYQADKIKSELKDIESKYKVKIVCSKEEEPLGTAGPIKLAEAIIKEGGDDGLLFVFNSDIVCDYPLKELVDFHKTHKKEGTIVLATVQDPSRFGVIVSNAEGRVQSFVEKPKHFISNKINAGIYLLSSKVVNRIPERFCMIEKEIFPQMAKEGELYAINLKEDNFWHDIGQPKDYLIGQESYLKYYKLKGEGETFEGNVLVDKTSTIHPTAKIGPNVVIGPGCVVGQGARVKNSTIFRNTKVKRGAYVSGSIISWDCIIGEWARVEGMTIIAECVKLKDEVRVSEAIIMSQKEIGANLEKGAIIM